MLALAGLMLGAAFNPEYFVGEPLEQLDWKLTEFRASLGDRNALFDVARTGVIAADDLTSMTPVKRRAIPTILYLACTGDDRAKDLFFDPTYRLWSHYHAPPQFTSDLGEWHLAEICEQHFRTV